jgi:hypothetical protein
MEIEVVPWEKLCINCKTCTIKDVKMIKNKNYWFHHDLFRHGMARNSFENLSKICNMTGQDYA